MHPAVFVFVGGLLAALAVGLGAIGDRLIVMVFSVYDEDEKPLPKILIFDSENNITQVNDGAE